MPPTLLLSPSTPAPPQAELDVPFPEATSAPYRYLREAPSRKYEAEEGGVREWALLGCLGSHPSCATYFVTLTKSFNLPVPQFSHVYNGENNGAAG